MLLIFKFLKIFGALFTSSSNRFSSEIRNRESFAKLASPCFVDRVLRNLPYRRLLFSNPRTKENCRRSTTFEMNDSCIKHYYTSSMHMIRYTVVDSMVEQDGARVLWRIYIARNRDKSPYGCITLKIVASTSRHFAPRAILHFPMRVIVVLNPRSRKLASAHPV